MKREDVYKLIDGEREYQLNRSEIMNAEKPNRDEDHHVADWIIYMEAHLEDAKKALYSFNTALALSHIRKATALGVACMENNETEERN